MTRYLTTPSEPSAHPMVTEADVADIVENAVFHVLDTAETWLGWSGAPVCSDGNTWTPHKALRRVTDHLIDHLAEIECRLQGIPTIPDRWHGRRLTLDTDWARFTEADLDEATSRLTRLAIMYEATLSRLDDDHLNYRPDRQTWSIREVVHHVSNVTYYADRIGRL